MAPTLVTTATLVVQSAANTTALTTASFTPSAGELIVVKVVSADPTLVIGATTGGSLTYTTQATVATANHCPTLIRTATVGGSPAAMTVSTAFSGTGQWHSMLVERWSGAQLAATPANTQTSGATNSAPTATVTTTGTDSVVSWSIGDWLARSPTGRTYQSSATEDGIHDGSTGNYVAYYAYQAAAVAGAQTVGMTFPSTQTPSIAGIEIQAAAGGGGGATAIPGRPQPYVSRRRAANW